MPVDRLSASQLRVLAAVCELSAQGPVTYRAIMAHTGYGSPESVRLAVHKLIEAGLVSAERTWRNRSGTLRPLCSITLFKEGLPHDRT